jgi:hypothetical protein
MRKLACAFIIIGALFLPGKAFAIDCETINPGAHRAQCIRAHVHVLSTPSAFRTFGLSVSLYANGPATDLCQQLKLT